MLSRWTIGLGFIFVLCGVLLAGCDIAPEAQLHQTPLNSGNGGNGLDAESADNLTAYFYAGRPVEGLIFSCTVSGRAPVTGSTDEDGRFVCPRASSVSFFVGVAGVGTYKIGGISLGMFGLAVDAAARNNVAITPATLYGAATDGDNVRVANIFNLLVSLDTATSRSGTYQPTIVLGSNMLGVLVASAHFSELNLALSTSAFASMLQPLVADVNANLSVNLVLSLNRPAAPVLSGAEAIIYANEGIARAREGLYRTNSFVYEITSDSTYSLTSAFVVGGDGKTHGYSVADLIVTSPSRKETAQFMPLSATAQVLPDGTLNGFSFSATSEDTLTFLGNFINDAITGESRLCNPSSPNRQVPDEYCNATEVNDGFSVSDQGRFNSSRGFSGELYVGRLAESLPDIDLDLIPDYYLPRTFEVTLGRYTDIQSAELKDALYLPVTADKSVFGTLSALPSFRYTIMPNGDIVSDLDGDCAAVSRAGGEYWDDDAREILLGRAANVIQVSDKTVPPVVDTYLTMQFMIMEPVHPFYGLNLGFDAINRDLFPMVLNVSDGKLLSKKACDDDGKPCSTLGVEWFNDVVYMRDVVVVDLMDGNAEVNGSLYLNEPYYGQVTSNTEVNGSTTICRAP